MTGKEVIIKNKALINISSNATLAQRRLFNAILHKIYDQLGDFSKESFTLSKLELIELLGGRSKINYKKFMEDCKSLMRTIITWNILETNNELEEFEIYVLLASVIFNQGNVEIEMPMLLRRKIIESNQYIKLNLQLQNKFTSKYSLILYEIAKEFYRERERVGETPWLKLENIRQLLGIEDSEYGAYKRLKKDVLNKAIKEINKVSDLSLSFEEKKLSRRVVALKFKMVKNIQTEVIPEKQTVKTTPDVAQAPVRSTQPSKQLVMQLMTYQINKNKIDMWIEKYPTDYLQAKIDYMEQQMQAGKTIILPAGFLVKAVEEDFGGSEMVNQNIIDQRDLEARKLNHETFLVYPMEFDSLEEFETRLEALRSEYYNPRWIESEYEQAESTKWSKVAIQRA
ncbi:MAG: replication initiation protein [Patescibacteria group bacterium]